MLRPMLAALVALVVSAAAVAHAQPTGSTPALERQVALDEAGGVFEIDRRLALRLGLFADHHANFHSARLLVAADGAHVLEITLRPEGRGGGFVRERRPISADEVAALRREVSAGLRAHAPERLHDQEGRPRLVTGFALLGLGWYGWSVPLAISETDPETALLTYVLIGSGSVFIPYFATHDATVTEADADFAIWGATRGIAHGLLIDEIVRKGEGTDDYAALISTGTSILEGVAFYGWSRAGNFDAGTTSAMGLFGDYGTLAGYGLVAAVEGDTRAARTPRAAAALVGTAAGVAAGRLLGPSREWTRGDAGVARTTMLTGGLVGAAVAEAVTRDDDDGEALALGAVLGGAAGLVAGDRLTRGLDFTTGESRLIVLGAAAGGLLGLGASLVADDDAGDVALATSAVGSALGLAAIYATLDQGARAGRDDGKDRARFAIAVNPAAVVALRGGGQAAANRPWVTATWRLGPAGR